MSDFNHGFWSLYIAGFTAAGIAGCLVLLWLSGRKKVAPGDVVVCEVDCALLHDLSARSCRVVWETENFNSLKVFSRLCNSVVFPEPEGAETM